MASKTLTIVGFATVEDEHQKVFLQAADDMVTISRKEDGCLESTVHQDINDPNKFVLYEIWEDQETWTKHLQQRHLLAFSDLVSHISSDLQLRKFVKCNF